MPFTFPYKNINSGQNWTFRLDLLISAPSIVEWNWISDKNGWFRDFFFFHCVSCCEWLTEIRNRICSIGDAFFPSKCIFLSLSLLYYIPLSKSAYGLQNTAFSHVFSAFDNTECDSPVYSEFIWDSGFHDCFFSNR